MKTFLRLSLALLLVALLPTLLVDLLHVAPVENLHQPSLLYPVLILLGALLVLHFYPRPLFRLALAALLAGSAANTLYAQLRPVPDYLPLPWDAMHFLNVADLLILLSIFLSPFLLLRLLSDQAGYQSAAANQQGSA